ncbi:MAG: CoA-disulfide reductase [Mycoplasmatales bacterium]
MKVVIIGGNAAGMSFAAKYKRNNKNHEVVVLEKRDYVSFGSCGLPYFVGGMFDDKERMILRSPKQIIDSGIDLKINATVINVEFDIKTVAYEIDGSLDEISYDKLIIASGASPIVPNFGKYNSAKVHTLTSLEDGLKVKELLKNKNNKNITIIGGGFIGLEIMDVAHHLDKKITLIEMNDHILGNQFSDEMINIVEDSINNTNINLMLSTKVLEIKDKKDSYSVITDKKVVDADIIILALGFKPNTEFVELEKISNGAILTCKSGQTSFKDVYAVGDCATVHHIVKGDQVYLPLATTANKRARSLADYISGVDVTFDGMLGSSCLKVLDFELARTGINEKDAIDMNIDYKVAYVTDKNQTDYYPGQEEIRAKLIYDKNTHVILGCEMIGKSGVVGRIDAIAVCIYAKLTTKELGYLDFCYSPPFSRTWDMLNVIGNVAK